MWKWGRPPPLVETSTTFNVVFLKASLNMHLSVCCKSLDHSQFFIFKSYKLLKYEFQYYRGLRSKKKENGYFFWQYPVGLEYSIHSFERTKQGTRRKRRKARRKEWQQEQFRHQKKRESMVFFLLLEISEENCETD